MVQIIKKDGSLETFDKSKISMGLTHAGLLVSDANVIADEVEQWLPQIIEEDKVDSFVIRDRVVELLEERDPEAAKRFIEYKKQSPS